MTSYEQGFMDKCAELGIAPETLLKAAAGAQSRSEARREALRVSLTQSRSFPASPTNYKTLNDEFRKRVADDWEDIETAPLWVQRSYQAANQRKRFGVDPARHDVSERFGFLTSSLGAGALGALAGGAISRSGRGAAGGALAGVGASMLAYGVIAPIVAAIRRRRTAEEQADHDRGSTAANWLVPGVSTYNSMKRDGRAMADWDDEARKYYGRKQ